MILITTLSQTAVRGQVVGGAKPEPPGELPAGQQAPRPPQQRQGSIHHRRDPRYTRCKG